LVELVMKPVAWPRAPTVVFLLGGAKPWSCQEGKLLFPAVRETGEGRPAMVALKVFF